MSKSRSFKTKAFSRWAERSGISDQILLHAVSEMSKGLIDADLGGGLIKKRVAVPGSGKRGGARTFLATNKDDRWVFLYGFEKNEAEDVSARSYKSLKESAKELLSWSEEKLDHFVSLGALKELIHE